MKAHNPYSQSTEPILWAGWEAGFSIDDPGWIPSQAKKDQFSREFWQAFYRGQGAQIVKNYSA